MNEQKNKWTQCKSLRKRHSYSQKCVHFVEPCTSFEFPTTLSTLLYNNKVFFLVIFTVFIHSFVNSHSLLVLSASLGLPSCQKGCEIPTSPRRRRWRLRKNSGTRIMICVPRSISCALSWMATGIQIRGGTWGPASITPHSSSGSSSWTRELLPMMIGAGDIIHLNLHTLMLIHSLTYKNACVPCVLRDPRFQRFDTARISFLALLFFSVWINRTLRSHDKTYCSLLLIGIFTHNF